MPLFGHNNKEHANPSTLPPTTYGEPGITAGTAGGGRHHVSGMDHNAGVGNTTGAYGSGMDHTSGAYGTDMHSSNMNSSNLHRHNENYGTDMTHEPGIPPSSHISSSTAATAGSHGTTGHSGGSGKLEKAMGTLVGSKTLKAKGLEKEREAQAFKVQSAELAEAERLEHEARTRRERAVAHGAHPENRHLGGGAETTGY